MSNIRHASNQGPIKISVHDGLGMRPITISPVDTQLDVLEKTALAMKRPNHAIEIGYEAPWSSKIGTKKCLAYLSTQDELDDFWLAYERYGKSQLAKKRKNGEEKPCDIVFRNMLDGSAVRVPLHCKIAFAHAMNLECCQDNVPFNGSAEEQYAEGL